MHEYLKEHVGKLSKIIIDPAGHRRVVVRSSTNLSKPEFEEYMGRVRAWAAGFGVGIPLPNEEASAFYGDKKNCESEIDSPADGRRK